MSKYYGRLSPAPIPKVNAWSSNILLQAAAKDDSSQPPCNDTRESRNKPEKAGNGMIQDARGDINIKNSFLLNPSLFLQKYEPSDANNLLTRITDPSLLYEMPYDYSFINDSGYESDISSIVIISSTTTATKSPPFIMSPPAKNLADGSEEGPYYADSLSSISSPLSVHAELSPYPPYYPAIAYPVRKPDGKYKWALQYYFPQPQELLSPMEYVPSMAHSPPFMVFDQLSLQSPVNLQNEHHLGAPNKKTSRSATVKKQLKYYFSVENLCKDIYLRQQFNPKTGGVKIDTILTFNKIKCILGKDKHTLVHIIRNHCSKFLELVNNDSEVRINNWKTWALPKPRI